MGITLAERGFDFSIRMAELTKYLREDVKGFPLCDRLLFCGVTAGLNIRSGRKPEAAQLVAEADYIIEMAVAAGYMTHLQSVHIRADCGELFTALNEIQAESKSEEDLS